jgi:hypothetical protein
VPASVAAATDSRGRNGTVSGLRGACYQGRWRYAPRMGARVWKQFVFSCWDCEEDNYLDGEQTGFWGTRWLVDSEWHCWCCGALNATHDPPWTEAD